VKPSLTDLTFMIQRRLYALDFDPGPIDGDYGKQTANAILTALAALSGSAIPIDWLSPVPMRRVICHWTAGSYNANSVDISHYHILIEGQGNLIRGVDIAKNSVTLKPGYAAHTLNTNTGAIGVTLCGMAHAEERPFNPGPFPITLVQWQRMIEVCIELCRFYGIAPDPTTLLTHAEVQSNLNIPQRGKWDIAILPFLTHYDSAKEVGDLLRAQVKEAL
jgi:hypothetical protein